MLTKQAFCRHCRHIEHNNDLGCEISDVLPNDSEQTKEGMFRVGRIRLQSVLDLQ